MDFVCKVVLVLVFLLGIRELFHRLRCTLWPNCSGRPPPHLLVNVDNRFHRITCRHLSLIKKTAKCVECSLDLEGANQCHVHVIRQVCRCVILPDTHSLQTLRDYCDTLSVIGTLKSNVFNAASVSCDMSVFVCLSLCVHFL